MPWERSIAFLVALPPQHQIADLVGRVPEEADRSADCRRRCRAIAATMLPPMIQAISAAMTICVPRNGRRPRRNADGEAERNGMRRGAQAAQAIDARSGSSGSSSAAAKDARAPAPSKLSGSRRLNSITTSNERQSSA